MDKFQAIDELNGMTENRHGAGPLEGSKNLQRTAYREALQTAQANMHLGWKEPLEEIREVLGI